MTDLKALLIFALLLAACGAPSGASRGCALTMEGYTVVGTIVQGTVVNGNSACENVVLNFNLYDENGAVIGEAATSLAGLPPNARWNFRAHARVIASTAKVVRLVGWAR